MKFTGHERDLANLGGTGDDLDYMHARTHSPLTGRFLAVDRVGGTPKSPQSWNRYAYVRNNPLAYVDPTGKCAVPAGLKEGQVGICIESFIAAPRIGGIGFGDNRRFAPNDPEATFRTTYRMIMDPKTGRVVAERALAGVSEVGLREPTIGLRGSTSARGAVSTDAQGHSVSVFISGKNGFAALNDLGIINIAASLRVDRQGNVSVDRSSRTKTFPSIEGYAYRIVNGELVIQVLFQLREDDPDALNEPMNTPLVE